VAGRRSLASPSWPVDGRRSTVASVTVVAGARFAFLDHPGPIAFAHRGGALEAFENTWTSFTHARDLGYRYIETDVNASADGVVLTLHDPYLDRVTDQSGLVREMTWRQLSSIRLDGGHGGEAIPRLDELLGAWPEMRWNLDAKHDSAVDPLVETLRRADAVERVCVTSFSDRRLTRIRRALGPGLCTAMGPAAVSSLRAISVLPQVLATPAAAPLGRFGAVQVPLRQGWMPLVDRRFVAAAHGAGVQVHVWTIDDETTMARLLDLGVDGIMTDRPRVLKELLERRHAWS
jgi:glycerophosphoryl diester phosphodiesterase